MRILYGIYIVSLVFYQNQAKNDFTIELEDITMNITGPKIVKFINHTLYNKKVVAIEFLLLKPIRDLNLKLSMNLLKKNNKPMNLFKVNVNGCQGHEAQKTPYIRQVFEQLNRVSNLPLKNCVALANKLYYVKNYTLMDDANLPFLLISMWTFTMEFYSGKNPAAVVVVTGRFRKI